MHDTGPCITNRNGNGNGGFSIQSKRKTTTGKAEKGSPPLHGSVHVWMCQCTALLLVTTEYGTSVLTTSLPVAAVDHRSGSDRIPEWIVRIPASPCLLPFSGWKRRYVLFLLGVAKLEF